MIPAPARAFWVTGAGRGELRDELLPPPGPGQVLVKTMYTGISRGTESIVFSGRVPESEHRRMRCPYQGGEFPAPVKYGYSNVGRVVDGPLRWRDRAVFSLFPHQTAYVIDERAIRAVPAGVPPERAVLAANLETAINALWDARPQLGDRVTVVGAGVVGCLCAYLLGQLAAADVELIDLRPDRAGTARVLGVGFATPEGARPDRDLVFHTSGTGAGLATSLSLAAADATIVELSWFGDGLVGVPLGADFHVRRLTLRSSQVGTLSPSARRRWTAERRLELALELCRDERLDCLFSGESPFESLPETMAELCQPDCGVLCHRVRYT